MALSAWVHSLEVRLKMLTGDGVLSPRAIVHEVISVGNGKMNFAQCALGFLFSRYELEKAISRREIHEKRQERKEINHKLHLPPALC